MLTRREPLELNTGTTASASLIAGCAVNAAPLIEQTSHRTWPLPETAWFLFMHWHDLLFLHWPVRPETIRPLIPRVLELDTFDGWCWIGIVPFSHERCSTALPSDPFGFSRAERPHLREDTAQDRCLVLQPGCGLAVRAARWLGMPYYNARMKVGSAGESVDYKSLRDHKKAAAAEFEATYAPTGETYMAQTGTLDHWLTERYCLFSALKPDRIVFGEIHHPQWCLQPARVELRSCTMLPGLGD